MSPSPLAASVVGASGYAGAEVVALLADHPVFEIGSLVSRTYSEQPFSDLYPACSGKIDNSFEPLEYEKIAEVDVVFLAVPHTTSMQIVPELRRINPSLNIVDLAADYRFNSVSKFEEVYGVKHNDPQNVSEAVYGLSEYNKDDIKAASLVANPGCYATAALVPMIALGKENLLGDTVFVDAKSGISGAGRGPSEATSFVNCNNQIKPYKVGSHRHQPEILEHTPGSENISLRFVPHTIPADRGIEAAIYFTPPEDGLDKIENILVNLADKNSLFRYRKNPAGIKAVANTPFCDLNVHCDEKTAVVFSCIDNLQKGAASQAIQNANLISGLNMNLGLE